MTITQVGVGASASNTAATNLNVSQHASTLVGDLMLMFVVVASNGNGNNVTVTTPTGWTLLHSYLRSGSPLPSQASGRYTVYVFYREAASAGVVGHSVTGYSEASVELAARIISLRGHRPIGVDGGPFVTTPTSVVTEANTSSSTGLNVDVPAITPAKADGLLLHFVAVGVSSNATPTFTPAAGYTNLYSQAAAGVDTYQGVAYKDLVGGPAAQPTVTHLLRGSTSTVTYSGEWGLAVHIAEPNRAPTAPAWGANPVAAAVYNATVPYAITAGTDPDGDTLVYDVDRSTDGTSWTNVVTGLAAGSLAGTFDSTLWPASATTRLRVRARDSYGAASAYVSSSLFTVQHNQAPNAPTLVAPAAAAYTDLATGPTFSWTFSDPDAGDSQSAYALRRKVGAGAYEYWNATLAAWQGTEVWNASVTGSVVFGAGKWTNGTTYSWSVATKDAAGVQGPYATDRTVTGSTAPTTTVTAPSGSVTNTTVPVVTWSYADPEGSPQQDFQVRVFTAAQYGIGGFDPLTSPATYDSGVVVSASARSHQVGSPGAVTGAGINLVNGTTYRAYVLTRQAGNQRSPSAFSTFTINVSPPTAPAAPTATFQAANDRHQVLLPAATGMPAGIAAATQYHLVRRSLDGGATWEERTVVLAANGQLVLRPVVTTQVGATVAPAGSATVYDYEVPHGKTPIYRARVQVDV